MNLKRVKFVRFEDWSSERSFSSDGELHARQARPSIAAVLSSIRRGFEMGSERIKSLKKPLSFYSYREQPEKKVRHGKKTLNPQGTFLQKWNKMFLLSCAIALAVDPLFLYIPVVDKKKYCLNLDKELEIIACVLRTFIDAFYVLRIIFQFKTAFIAPPSRVLGRGELIEDPLIIAKRYLCSNFTIDVVAILPLPQIVVLLVIPSVNQPVALITKDFLIFVIFSQYLPRILRIIPLYKDVTRTSGGVTETALAGAALNLLLFMLASHAFGAFWYLLSIERKDRCWRDACKDRPGCNFTYLYCDKSHHGDTNDFLKDSCPIIQPKDIKDSKHFDFGIFIDALESGVVESRDFPQKFFYCFWWGLRNLSSLGQNLKTSLFVGEIMFAVLISITGLVLFSLLIGNMQRYLQSTTVRVEEMRVRRQDAEQWMSHRMLPENLRERIRRYEQYKWQETRGVEEQSMLHNLPKDIRRDVKRHLCLSLLMRVPMFNKMDEQLLDAMCDRLKPALYTESSHVVREGDPVEEMLFIMRGSLVSTTTNGGRTGFFNSVYLKAGDFCGEALLTWALDPQAPSNLPLSTRTVQALSEVEGFALMADDLKFVAKQFRRMHSKQLQHAFRVYSVQWRTWAACFIQSAWRRHCKRKMAKSLREAEDRLQDALVNDSGNSPSLGATIYASRFAAKALRLLRQNGSRNSRIAQRLPPLLPQKPTEPDFTVDDS